MKIGEYRDKLLKEAHKKGRGKRPKKGQSGTKVGHKGTKRGQNVSVEDMLKVHPAYKPPVKSMKPVKKSKSGQKSGKSGKKWEDMGKYGKKLPEIRIREQDLLSHIYRLMEQVGYEGWRMLLDNALYEYEKANGLL